MTAIQYLKTQYLEANRLKYPSLPSYARSAPKYSDKTTNGLTRCIIDFIRLNNGQAERISVSGRYIDNSKIVTDCIGKQRRIGSGTWINPSMQKGTADISATILGRSVKIEVKCKATKDRIRPEQLEYKKQVEQAGGIYVVATDLESFVLWYKQQFPAATGNK